MSEIPDWLKQARERLEIYDNLRVEHESARYEGDGDPGCVSGCTACRIDVLRRDVQRWKDNYDAACSEIDELKKKFQEHTGAVAMIKDQRKTIEVWYSKVQEQNVEIENLRKKVSAQRSALRGCLKNIKNHEASNQELRADALEKKYWDSQEEIKRLKDLVEKLRYGIETYSMHDEYCSTERWMGHALRREPEPKCDCGLDDLKELAK